MEEEPRLELEGRAPYAVYRHNLFAHVGAVSSFAVRPDRYKWPRCFASLSSAWSLQDVEKYQAKCTGVSDVSPCDPDALPEERWARMRVDWGGQAPPSRAQRLSERSKRAEHRHGG
ncbi:hypothetical protein H632_c659p2 [Helicosporidium sp. ATCC 50920]|nr:hypothetical protein H632_c659p2 [Helicosporidium sp. ATCC 50920]|eukprot:KDD75491.1 hypothetical protein H632_c659p2 [Helicosporidium sp. ATCC 50920]